MLCTSCAHVLYGPEHCGAPMRNCERTSECSLASVLALYGQSSAAAIAVLSRTTDISRRRSVMYYMFCSHIRQAVLSSWRMRPNEVTPGTCTCTCNFSSSPCRQDSAMEGNINFLCVFPTYPIHMQASHCNSCTQSNSSKHWLLAFRATLFLMLLYTDASRPCCSSLVCTPHSIKCSATS